MSTTSTETKSKDLMTFTTQTYGDWRDEFHKNGCVLIKNVVSPERAKYYQEKQIEWLHNFDLGFDENNPETWTQEHLPISFKGGQVFTLAVHTGTKLTCSRMYFAYASPHEKMAWEARMEPGVVEIFEKLWETKELITSFDGMNISMPNRKDLAWSPWPHCDQNQDRKG